MQNYKGNLLKRDKYFFIDRYVEILRKMNYPESKVNAFKKHGDKLWERVKDLKQGTVMETYILVIFINH